MVQPFWQQDLATGTVLATAAEGPGSKPKGVSKGLQGPKWGDVQGAQPRGPELVLKALKACRAIYESWLVVLGP